ncbi:guanylate kinase [Phenylobacterium sp.]|uniref:guanylate kinase n=1 Tax=Phenylobacterium sp. TaxID=1871053 RepID=UPI00272F6008|nr:guanylate kinase [Phenylobacterium sp.]MDP1618328.1 guanylate kinase [Phenylobacterium sp.]MDP1987926.1 guanylate kinase [Phenylobacterium sp.]
MPYTSVPRRGLMLLISSPSGAGKTSLSRRLVADHADLNLSISATTRDPRPGEEDGREYHFVDRPAFDAMIEQDAFLEWANVHEHRYGSPKAPVMEALGQGQDVLFDIDWQGAAQIAEKAPSDVVRVFILPPSMAELSRRLHARAQDREDVIQRRLGRAYGEIERAVDYDYVIVNDDYDRAFADLAHIYHAERQKRVRNPGLKTFVQTLLDEQI